MPARTTTELVVSIITLTVILLILAVLGKFLWNEVIAGENGRGLIKGVREADSVWQILGLWILVSLFFN